LRLRCSARDGADGVGSGGAVKRSTTVCWRGTPSACVRNASSSCCPGSVLGSKAIGTRPCVVATSKVRTIVEPCGAASMMVISPVSPAGTSITVPRRRRRSSTGTLRSAATTAGRIVVAADACAPVSANDLPPIFSVVAPTVAGTTFALSVASAMWRPAASSTRTGAGLPSAGVTCHWPAAGRATSTVETWSTGSWSMSAVAAWVVPAGRPARPAGSGGENT
jgi:hypothetical protein